MQRSTFQVGERRGSLRDKLREGREHRVLKLVINGYKQMCAEGRYPARKHEEWFSAVLEGCIEELCPVYSIETGYQWDVAREYPNDSEQTRMGQANPRLVPRIDIVITYWQGLGKKKERFPFECKRIIENDIEHIKLYVKDGLIDRYLTVKDYASGAAWGGMIGYILQGTHQTVVAKLNKVMDVHINRPTEHLKIAEPIADFEAIYKSRHQRPLQGDFLTITHIFLPFLFHVDEATDDTTSNTLTI